MTTSYRGNSNLRKPAYSDGAWNAPLDANFDDLDASPLYGGLCCSLKEVPSASLNVKVSAGRFRQSDGLVVSFAGSASFGLTASATNYVYLDDSGTLTASTTGWPVPSHVPLAVAVCGGTTVTSLTDMRIPLISGGEHLTGLFLARAPSDGTNVVTVHTGSTHGVQIGGAPGDWLAFWGSVPGAQPSGANQAAITDSSGGTPSFMIAAISDTATANAIASLARQIDAIRTALVQCGLIKGGS